MVAEDVIKCKQNICTYMSYFYFIPDSVYSQEKKVSSSLTTTDMSFYFGKCSQ